MSYFVFNPCPADPGYTLSLQTVKIQIIWLLFVIQYVNLYPQSALSNLIGYNLKWVWHINLFSMTRG